MTGVVLVGVSLSRSIDDDAADASRENAGDGKGDDPAHVDPGNHAPVDTPPGARAKTDTNGGASDALGGGDGELCRIVVSLLLKTEAVVVRELTKSGGKDDGDGSSQFHGETTRGRVESQAVTQVAHDVVTISPDTEGNTSTTEAAIEGQWLLRVAKVW